MEEIESHGEPAARREGRSRGRSRSTLKEQIVLEHTPLIRYIVNRIAVRLPSHIDLDDLHNTGVIGLMDAIEKYDPDKNCKFKTYAEFRIKGAILDQLRSLDWVPRSVRQKSRRLERAYGEVEQRLGRSATRRGSGRLARPPARQVPRAGQPGARHLAREPRGDPRRRRRKAIAPAASPTSSRT